MSDAADIEFHHRHLLGIEGLSPSDIDSILNLSEIYVAQNRQIDKKKSLLRGRTQINLFFESSTRTSTSFELAGKRLGADVLNMSVSDSSITKGETLIDTAMTLNAMHPDVLVVRHSQSGAVELLSQKVDCAVINAGDGNHEHPTQALLDALTIRRRLKRLDNLSVAICGDILHSRVARSNILLLNTMGARVRVIAPPTLLPGDIERMGVEVFHDMRAGLEDVDIVMMLRLQLERMQGHFVPSVREYFHYYGLDRGETGKRQAERLDHASGTDEPGRRNRYGSRRRHSPQRDPRTGRNGCRRTHGDAGTADSGSAEYGVGRQMNKMTEPATAFIDARVIDPASGLDGPGGLLVRDGVIAAVGAEVSAASVGTETGGTGRLQGQDPLPRSDRHAGLRR